MMIGTSEWMESAKSKMRGLPSPLHRKHMPEATPILASVASKLSCAAFARLTSLSPDEFELQDSPHSNRDHVIAVRVTSFVLRSAFASHGTSIEVLGGHTHMELRSSFSLWMLAL